MKDNVAPELLEAIEEAAIIFQRETVANMVQMLRKKKLNNTSTLINSLDTEGKTDLGRLVHSISFAFEEYGRYQDMKGKRWRDFPNIDNLKAWVEKKRSTTPGYFGKDPRPNKKKPKTEERIVNEIAWAIGYKMRFQPKKDNGKAWFLKAFYRDLQSLKEQLIVSVGDHTLEQMKAELLARLKSGPTNSPQTRR